MTWLVRRICLVGSFDTVAWIRYSTKPLGTYQLSHSPHGCLHYAEALEFPVGRWLNFCCWIKPSGSVLFAYWVNLHDVTTAAFTTAATSRHGALRDLPGRLRSEGGRVGKDGVRTGRY